MRRARRLALAGLALLALAAAAGAEGRRMLEEAEQDRWRAVGRVNFGDGFCTGALIAPDRVLTAAHCLHAAPTGAQRRPRGLHFVAGYRQLRHAGHQRADSVTLHPDYVFATEVDAAAVTTDLALIRLRAPLEGATPLAVAAGLAPGDAVTIVSYARDRPEIASIQEGCRVNQRRGAVAALACDVTFGVSGAPVFRIVEGEPRIAAIVSAMGFVGGAPRAFAVVVEAALPALPGAP